MKQILKKLRKNVNNRMFDVAAAPMYLAIFGVPVLLAVVIAGLIVLAVKAVAKINREKKQKEDDL